MVDLETAAVDSVTTAEHCAEILCGGRSRFAPGAARVTVTLVTSNFHIARAAMLLRRALAAPWRDIPFAAPLPAAAALSASEHVDSGYWRNAGGADDGDRAARRGVASGLACVGAPDAEQDEFHAARRQ